MTAGVFPPEIIAAAQASQKRWNIPASVSLAQWALESAWGRSMPSQSNNPFGIKARLGQPAVTAETCEVVSGRTLRLPQRFRQFPDLSSAFDEHGRLLATARVYGPARAVRHDGRAFARALQGRYATDPGYAVHLIALIDAHDLTRFDG
ncbi:glycoside hydrolase family 73 protein [Lichenifustis flavocetrariae]|uniref:Glucosaminidase domain-containing protein n=1 Tax=Lichenifustis flavocetrariae TaxID=2949735 RepID=A0AA41YYN1_9HYPH|nr:glucosaminidase domain-containing protein [Lichenifustis flavocetrariae]MCW6511001.1 glucosaminidase domain-containing protein [Lichenifustis flavocetrariae]